MSCVQECTRVTKLAINREVGVLKIECRLMLKNSTGISMIMLLLYFKILLISNPILRAIP